MVDSSEAQIKKERAKARELRKSRWWQNLIQKTNCYYCQIELDRNSVTMDHIVPISRGGRSTKGNVVPCCKECNNKKRSMTTIEWQEFIDGSLNHTKKADS
jgi:5-methylcytosine-specific restriction protein A